MKIHEPPMTFINREAEEYWNKNVQEADSEAYVMGILMFASEWATRMELAINNTGSTLESIVEQTCTEADDEGITGNMHAWAVNILSKVWIHGETLRKWHNLDVAPNGQGEQANKEGGVLNPAVLIIK